MATPAVNEVSLLSRIIKPGTPFPSKAAAEALLALDFPPADKVRLRELAQKARTGGLAPEDQRAVEAYGRVGSLLSILKAKAQTTLSKPKRPRKSR